MHVVTRCYGLQSSEVDLGVCKVVLGLLDELNLAVDRACSLGRVPLVDHSLVAEQTVDPVGGGERRGEESGIVRNTLGKQTVGESFLQCC